MVKEEEMAEFRKYKSYYVTDIMRKLQQEEIINANKERRKQIYDAYINGELKEYFNDGGIFSI